MFLYLHLTFDKYIKTLCKNASNKLSALARVNLPSKFGRTVRYRRYWKWNWLEEKILLKEKWVLSYPSQQGVVKAKLFRFGVSWDQTTGSNFCLLLWRLDHKKLKRKIVSILICFLSILREIINWCLYDTSNGRQSKWIN